MNQNKLHLVLVCSLLFLSSCFYHKEDPEEVLTEVENLMSQYPDSVLNMLEMMSGQRSFPENLYNKYTLLYVQAKDKTDKDISGDTVIFKVKDYYIDKEDFEHAAQASFYAARVLQCNKDADREDVIKLLKDAELYAKSGNNNNLKGLIQYDMGTLLLHQPPREESILRLKSALNFFRESDEYKNEIIAYNQIGRCFLSDRLTDSAFFYYDKALLLATAHNDSLEQAFIKVNVGVAYEILDDDDSARKYYKEALPYFTDIENKVKTYTNIAWTFDNKTEQDSVLYYANLSIKLLENDNNPKLMALVYKLLSRTEEKRGNYKGSLAYQNQYIREMTEYFQEIQSQKLLDVQRKYDFELMKNENNRLFIERQSGYLAASVLFIIVLIITFIFYRKNVKNKETLLEAQQKILHLRNLANSYDAEKDSVRNVLIQHFGILKKAALLESYLKDDEKKQGEKLLKRFNEIVYNKDSFDWDSLFRMMNYLSDNFQDKLKRSYPQLDDIEYKICCLTEAELTNMEIAIILGLSVNTVQMKKSSIRKMLGIEGYGNIIEYLKRTVS